MILTNQSVNSLYIVTVVHRYLKSMDWGRKLWILHSAEVYRKLVV